MPCLGFLGPESLGRVSWLQGGSDDFSSLQYCLEKQNPMEDFNPSAQACTISLCRALLCTGIDGWR